MTTPVSTAVILAAGMGRRLGEYGLSRPKGFIQLGDRPIIEESICRLQRVGIERLVIVTGHCAKHYEALARRLGSWVTTVHNPYYATSGSMYSLSLVREVVDGAFLILESDIIYEQRALTEIQACQYETVLLLSGPTGAGDEVFVEASENRLISMSKNPEKLGHAPSGELVGISRVSMEVFHAMLDYADAAFRRSLYVDYETDGFVSVASTHEVYCHLVPDLKWAEIDDEGHWRRARDIVYPALRPCISGILGAS